MSLVLYLKNCRHVRNVVSSSVQKRFAGHSKWANIKHIKAAKDKLKSNAFIRHCQRMKVAIQETGDPNPASNVRLAQAIDAAKRDNMPMSSIQNCIGKANQDKNEAQSVWYEVRGPRGSMLIISTLTINPRRTRDTISPILKRHQATFADHSSRHLFEHKGIIIATPPSGLVNPDSAAEDHAIESGAEEVASSESEEGTYQFVCDIESFYSVKKNLEKLNYSIKESNFTFIPQLKVSLSETELEAMSKLLDKLHDHPDVVEIYDNID